MNNIVAEYDYYTLEQAREIINEENRLRREKRQHDILRKRKKKLYYLKQKAIGLVLCLVVIIISLIDNDMTSSIILAPLGIYMILTKKKLINV